MFRKTTSITPNPSIVAVPESETYWMLLLGLGLTSEVIAVRRLRKA